MTQARGVDIEPASLSDAIRHIGMDLLATISAVLGGIPDGPHRPNELADRLGLNRQITGRVLTAIGKTDPLEVAHFMPGPEPLRRVLRAARAHRVDPTLLDDAEAAVRRFDQFIRHEVGNRAALDAVISSSLPNARERFELSSKQSIFKGMSHLKGAQAETWLGAAIVQPDAKTDDRLDLTWLTGAVAIQRLRPGVTVRFSYRHLSDSPADLEHDRGPGVMRLDEYCTNPPAELIANGAGGVMNYTLPPDLLGPNAVVDTFVVDHHPAAMRRYGVPEPRNLTSLFVEPALPVANLLFDVYLHEDAFPGAEPQLFIYDTNYHGIANVKDASRDLDRVDLQESIELLGGDPRRHQAVEAPRYDEMLDHLFTYFRWDAPRFRGYRLRMQYPVYGWQVCMAFSPPLR